MIRLLATTGPRPMYVISEGNYRTSMSYSVSNVISQHRAGIQLSNNYEDYLELVLVAEADTVEGIIDQIPELLI
jgi:hypothetical protein